MNKILQTLIYLLVVSVLAIAAQNPTATSRSGSSSTRLENLAERLEQQTVELVNLTEQNLNPTGANNRREIEAVYLARQLDASVTFFRQMMRDEFSRTDLRDASALLATLVRSVPNSGPSSNLWNNAVNLVKDIEKELGGGSTVDNSISNVPSSGRAFWRGRVDNRVQLIIRERQIETKTIAGKANPAGVYSFTSTIPNRDVTIEVEKKDGRGQVNILQQPNRQNNYTTVLEIYDDGGGDDEYRLEIIWK